MSWPSRSPEETRALGRNLARALAERSQGRGWVVSLIGPLGAGKTQFAKGVAEGLGVPASQVASPTFVIANEWSSPGGGRLVHADWYRIESELELETAGLHDWLAPGTGLLVEWGDRFPAALPADRLEVRIDAGAGPDDRRVEAHPGGPASREALEAWSAACR
ncbi:MAG: tRNA (adenosine(37)-N6)-threonylcarbamoyltransferase complex ATPase subunit type 1 TsaE [Deltaproteobacteria bacterium]|jgi:tRNA threonylcarbamoyladenosine biosynthesis protein TsaE|nr:tRNA (adenosine(37)-N6)-threonylcarbamoyltransferase complex ATPase subunit type 1 TsaE [Deltaproteobacteria bacterium]